MSYRVGFYGDKDFSIAFYLDTVKEIFDSFSDDNSYSINDILELYSCVLILETGARHRKWSDSEYELLNKTKERVV